MNKCLKLILIFVFLHQIFNIASKAEDITSEILNIKADDSNLLVDVAKSYPKVKFTRFENQNKILIEFLNSKYHENFNYGPETEENVLNGLNFIRDFVAVEEKNADGVGIVSIVLSLKTKESRVPILKSTVGNLITITFNQTDTEQSKAQNPEEADISEMYNQAVEEQSKGNLEKAESIYNDVIAKDKNFYLAKYNLAKIYIDKKKYEKSLFLLEELIKNLNNASDKPENKNALLLVQNTIGTVYYFQDNFDKAIKKFKEILKFDSGFYKTYYNIALVYEKKKDLKNAIKNLEKTVNLEPKFAHAYYHLGVIELIRKKKKAAIYDFKKVLEIAPGTAIAHISQKELDKLEKK